MSSTGKGIEIGYPSITLHAISRAGDQANIYCQLDDSIASSEAQGDENDAVIEMRELVIVPEASDSRKSLPLPQTVGSSHSFGPTVENIFEALSICASLHPDPADADDMDEDDDAFIDADPSTFETFNGDAGEELSEVGRVRSNFLNDNRYAPY